MFAPQFKSPRVVLPLLFAILTACGDAPERTSADGAAIPESTAVTLLEQVASDPGVDLWLGDESAGIDREQMIDRFPLYAIHHDRFAVSGDHLQQLRAQRESVIAALKSRIESAATVALAIPGADTRVPSLETELAVALDLNAVELLSLLTGTAIQLQTFLQNFEDEKLESYLATPHARLHRNLLGAMSGILRQEGFEPVITEQWESHFTFEKAHGDTGINLLDDSILNDDSTPDLAIGGFAPFTTTFTQRIIDWSRQYLEQTPENGRKAAAGMETPVPLLR